MNGYSNRDIATTKDIPRGMKLRSRTEIVFNRIVICQS